MGITRMKGTPAVTPPPPSAARVRLRLLKEEATELFSRRVEEDSDPFANFYASDLLLEPPYGLERLYRFYEESDVLQECVEAMRENVDGFGYHMVFLGNDQKERETPAAKSEYITATNFFDHANESQSWTTVRKLMREDYESIGNGSLEIVRSLSGKVQAAYHVPFYRLRLTKIDPRPVRVPTTLPREGKIIKVDTLQYFRKYAQISVRSGRKLRWFKQFGDPRAMDATTGEYKKTAGDCKIVASEILHFRMNIGRSAYGLPRWLAALPDVVGRRSGQFVNYDLFNSQGIPPMAVLVSGGSLTDESIADLEALIRSVRGMENWNRVLVLESQVQSAGLEETGTAKLELKNLSEYRKEDLMFSQYLTRTAEDIRHRFRIPPLYFGGVESFTHATSKAARLVTEEQVFIPERMQTDEVINTQILTKELGITKWRYQTLGPKMVGSDEIISGVSGFKDAGAVTVNNAIALANQALGLEMSEFKEDWANYPMPLVMELLKGGRLKGLKDIQEANEKLETVQQALPGGKKPPLQLPEKIEKSDLFSEEEKRLYRRLATIQMALESVE